MCFLHKMIKSAVQYVKTSGQVREIFHLPGANKHNSIFLEEFFKGVCCTL